MSSPVPLTERTARLVIRHRALRTGDADDVFELHRICRVANDEVDRFFGGDPAARVESTRRELLDSIAAILSVQRIGEVLRLRFTDKDITHVEQIMEEIAKLLRASLALGRAKKRAGRQREFKNRDDTIYRLRQQGLSYGQIAKRLKIERLAAQAAYVREHRRRQGFRDTYCSLKDGFERFGILLIEE